MDRVDAGVAIQEVIVAVAGDRVVAVAAEDPVAGRAAAERILAAQTADGGRAAEGGGIDRVAVLAAGEQPDLDTGDGVRHAVEHHVDVAEIGVGVGAHHDRVGVAAAVIGVGLRAGRVRGVFAAAQRIDHDERVVARFTEDHVEARAADERVIAGTAAENVIPSAAEHSVVAAATADVGIIARPAEDHVGRSAAVELGVVAVAAVDPVWLRGTAEDPVVTFVAEEPVTALAPRDPVVAAAAPDPVLAALGDHVGGQVVAVVAMERVNVIAAAAVDEVVTVVQEHGIGHVAESDRDRLAGRNRDHELVAAEVGDEAPRHPGQAARREVGKIGDLLVSEPGGASAHGRLDGVESLGAGQAEQTAQRIRLQADYGLRVGDGGRAIVGSQEPHERRVANLHGRIEQHQRLIDGGTGIVGLLRHGDGPHLSSAGHGHVAHRVVADVVLGQDRPLCGPPCRGDVIKKDAVVVRADERGVVEGVEPDERRDARRLAEIDERLRDRVVPPEPMRADRGAAAGRAGDEDHSRRGRGEVAGFELPELANLRRDLRVGIDRVENALPVRGIRVGRVESDRQELLLLPDAARRRLPPGDGWHLLNRVAAGGEIRKPEAPLLRRLDAAVAIDVEGGGGDDRLHHPGPIGDDHELSADADFVCRLADVCLAWIVLPDRALDRGGLRCHASRDDPVDQRRTSGGRPDDELELEAVLRRGAGRAVARREPRHAGGPLAVEQGARGRRHRVVVEKHAVAAWHERASAAHLRDLVSNPVRPGRISGHEHERDRLGARGGVGPHELRSLLDRQRAGRRADLERQVVVLRGRDRGQLGGAARDARPGDRLRVGADEHAVDHRRRVERDPEVVGRRGSAARERHRVGCGGGRGDAAAGGDVGDRDPVIARSQVGEGVGAVGASGRDLLGAGVVRSVGIRVEVDDDVSHRLVGRRRHAAGESAWPVVAELGRRRGRCAAQRDAGDQGRGGHPARRNRLDDPSGQQVAADPHDVSAGGVVAVGGRSELAAPGVAHAHDSAGRIGHHQPPLKVARSVGLTGIADTVGIEVFEDETRDRASLLRRIDLRIEEDLRPARVGGHGGPEAPVDRLLDSAAVRAIVEVVLVADRGGAAMDRVGPLAGEDRVVAGAALDPVCPRAAVDHVTAVAAEDRRVATGDGERGVGRDHDGVASGAAEHVVVAAAKLDQVAVEAAVDVVTAGGAVDGVVALAAEDHRLEEAAAPPGLILRPAGGDQRRGEAPAGGRRANHDVDWRVHRRGPRSCGFAVGVEDVVAGAAGEVVKACAAFDQVGVDVHGAAVADRGARGGDQADGVVAVDAVVALAAVELVVAGAALELVVARATVHRVVAESRIDVVVARAGDDHIVAVAAGDRVANRRSARSASFVAPLDLVVARVT